MGSFDLQKLVYGFHRSPPIQEMFTARRFQLTVFA
jgi:hypothetical protein